MAECFGESLSVERRSIISFGHSQPKKSFHFPIPLPPFRTDFSGVKEPHDALFARNSQPWLCSPTNQPVDLTHLESTHLISSPATLLRSPRMCLGIMRQMLYFSSENPLSPHPWLSPPHIVIVAIRCRLNVAYA